MDYVNARPLIQTGDILAVRGHSMLSRVTRVVQRLAGLGDHADVTHIGVARWMNGRLYSVEMDGRFNVLRPLSHHIHYGCRITVHSPPVARTAIDAAYDIMTEQPIVYGVTDLIRIGLRLLTGFGDDGESESDLVCSTFVTRWLQLAGWQPPPGFPRMAAPGECTAVLGNEYMEIAARR